MVGVRGPGGRFWWFQFYKTGLMGRGDRSLCPTWGQRTFPLSQKAIKSFDLMAFIFFHPDGHREVGEEKYDNTSDFKGQVIRNARTEIGQDSGGFGWVC